MRRMIENIERWKVNLSDWMDISIDKIYRYTEPNYSYKDSKRKIENLEVLKILDNQDDINLRQKNDAIKYLFSMIPTTFILYIFFSIFFGFIAIILPPFFYIFFKCYIITLYSSSFHLFPLLL